MAKTKHVLNVSKRSLSGSANARRLRKQGLIPAVIYSRGEKAETISVNAQEWEAVSKHELNLLSLIDGKDEKLVLLKEVQNDFMLLKAMHLDFLEVRKDQKITATVSVHAGHEAPAGASLGGILEQNIHEIEVECLPDALPESIIADVSPLKIGEFLHVSDLVLPEGVKAVSQANLVVFTVIDPAASGDTEAAAGEEAAAQPEVVGAKEKAEKAEAAAADKKK